MIAKPFAKSLHADALIALNKRLPQSHEKYALITSNMKQKIAGDIGEEVVMKELEKLQLPYPFYIFHNLFLYSENPIQLDILVITPYFALILEVKNILGEIEILTNPSLLVRTKPNSEIDTFNSPIPQLQEYIYQLSHLFKQSHIHLPVYGAVVFGFAKSYIKTAPQDINFLLTNEVRYFIRNITTANNKISSRKLEDLKDWLMHKNKEYKAFPISKQYSIHPLQIITGVECKGCGFLGMEKVYRKWYCPKCQQLSKNAHEDTLRDYFLVYKETINNKECRHFFHLKDKYEARRILKSPKLLMNRNAKNTTYTLNTKRDGFA